MFIDAIDKVDKFTRPLHSIARNYGSTEIIPGTATLFFINEEDYAITCEHVAKGLYKQQKYQ